MKCDRTFFLIGCLVIGGSWLATGCQQQDRQMIFTNPRTLPNQGLTAKGPTGRAATASSDVPPRSRSIPDSHGIDVPIVTPE